MQLDDNSEEVMLLEAMTKERLEAYRKSKVLIGELEKKLENLPEDESLIGNSVIFDYRKGYGKPQSVVGYDEKLAAARQQRWEKRLAKLYREVEIVDEWIESIPEGDAKRCIELVYVDGMTMKAAGRVLHMDKSTVSKKISNFLKMATKSTNATL